VNKPLLTSANNIALQYDHNDWLSLCTCIMQEYRLHTFCFGDRKLLNKQVLDSFFDSQA
jgi:Fe-S cluster biosynthesis and repair protein YggX